MTRNEAIDLLARHELAELGVEERESMLLDWWPLDEDDSGWASLSDAIRAEMKQGDLPQDAGDPKHDPLLLHAIRHSFVGVVNTYLQKRLAAIGHPNDVEGLVETLVECPCCGYRNLREGGGYEICRVCFWEDDGNTDAAAFSGPNHMTLRDARRNIAQFGAVDEAARRYVLHDGRDRYARNDTE